MRPIEIPHDGNPDGWIRLARTQEVRTHAAAVPTLFGEDRARWLATRVAIARAREIRVALTTSRIATSWISSRPVDLRVGSDGPVYVVAVAAPATVRGGPRSPSRCDWYAYVVAAGTGDVSSELGPRTCNLGVFLDGAAPWPPPDAVR